MREDISSEEATLKAIISSCELILDDMESGASISQSHFNNLGFVDGIMFRMQQDVNKQFTPTNVEHGTYDTDRIYCDDEHGNTL